MADEYIPIQVYRIVLVVILYYVIEVTDPRGSMETV